MPMEFCCDMCKLMIINLYTLKKKSKMYDENGTKIKHSTHGSVQWNDLRPTW